MYNKKKYNYAVLGFVLQTHFIYDLLIMNDKVESLDDVMIKQQASSFENRKKLVSTEINKEK